MVLRLHFTAEDLVRVRVWVLGPLAETQWSLRILRQQTPNVSLFAGWRTRVLRQAPPTAASLAGFLAPHNGGATDLFTLAGRVDTLDAGLEQLRSLPATRLHAEFAAIPGIARRMPPWLGPAVTGDHRAREDFLGALQQCHDAFIGPVWPRLRLHLEAECMASARKTIEGGVDKLLSELHPLLVWNPPVLELPTYKPWTHQTTDIHLDGRGLILAPSLFCPTEPQIFTPTQDDAAPILMYRASQDAAGISSILAPPDAGPSAALTALLGRTRATALAELAVTANTTMLAQRLGVTTAAASQHLSVLRSAGLVASRRDGNKVWHTLTPLGLSLLQRHTPTL
ncbi:ArsR family transcriptional regulator [Streptomyces sp. NPDC001851]|uniref:ArsR/SmtB family transcription factor n=1 Tax=Streptomyces sp. NPDC001851 TaxID=3154529 RepID=UPI00331BF2FE